MRYGFRFMKDLFFLSILTVMVSVGLFMIGIYLYRSFGVGESILGGHGFLDSEIVYLPIASGLVVLAFAKENRCLKLVLANVLATTMIVAASMIFRLGDGIQDAYIFISLPIAVALAVILKLVGKDSRQAGSPSKAG